MIRRGVLKKHTVLYLIGWSGSEHYCNLKTYDYSIKHRVHLAKEKANTMYGVEATSELREETKTNLCLLGVWKGQIFMATPSSVLGNAPYKYLLTIFKVNYSNIILPSMSLIVLKCILKNCSSVLTCSRVYTLYKNT